MIGYFNFMEFNGSYLITNDFGQYAFITKSELMGLLSNTLDYESSIGRELLDKGFIYKGSMQAYLQSNTNRMRDSKNYLFNATSLHIIVVSTLCNMSCVYCQANSVHGGNMELGTADKIVDTILNSPNQHLTIEFQGGEPLINYPAIRYIIEKIARLNSGKDIRFSIVSNLTLLTDDMVCFFAEYNVSISTSLDGNEAVHNVNRPYANGTGTYFDVIRSIEQLRTAKISVGAIETTTRHTLEYPQETVDVYYDLGFSNISLRPLSPLGCASQRWAQIGYSAKEFLEFYHASFSHIIEKNLRGEVMQENTAAIFLSKIVHEYPVNYMELRSPCGAITGQLAYYYTGDIFTCDEGRMLYEMGDPSFRLGKAGVDSYNDIIRSRVCSPICKASVLEAVPVCCDCVYQPFCGVCPVINKALYNDVIAKAPYQYRCAIYRGVLNEIFSILQESNTEKKQVLSSWNV